MKTSLASLSTKDFYLLIKQIISTSRLEKYYFVHQNEFLRLLETESATYEATKDKLIPEKESVEEVRDRACIVFNLLMEGMQTFSKSDKPKEATAIPGLMKQYSTSLHRLSRTKPNAEMSKLLTALFMETVLQTLGLTVVFEHPKNNCEVVFSEQIGSSDRKLQELNLTWKKRQELEKTLLNYLGTVSKMEKLSVWKALYTDLNEIVKNSCKITTTRNAMESKNIA